MMKTPTVHNPTNFEPADYEVLDYLDNKRPEYCGEPVEVFTAACKLWERDMEMALGSDWRRKAHRCIHCGNGNVRWITVCLHQPTNERVVFGADCTERLGFANKLAFKLAQLKARAEAGHARMKIWNARNAFLASRPDFAAAVEQAKGEAHAKNAFAQDVIGKLNAYGSLSDKQVEAVIKSLAKDIERANAPVVPKGNAPTGRVTVTGKIISTKVQESDFGSTLKMLLELENNSRVWLSVPSKATVERGQTITVTATFTVSEKDPSFAFGSRPTMRS